MQSADVVLSMKEDDDLEYGPHDDKVHESYQPWYLQHQAENKADSQPVAEGQETPDIPLNSPDILEPIVSHVLTTLGLTNLTLLDLRPLTDPPPALGANLFMLLATARSEKHLHASADKLCRWLRTEHKLSPYADGLLGRNEMKIAIRRQVRKSKMMSAVGSGGGDNGELAASIRAGWVCVNVGQVDGGVSPDTPDAESDQNIVGFGTRLTKSTIVVQMLTEEKRVEVGLEELWEDVLKKQAKLKEYQMAGTKGEDFDSVAKGVEDWPSVENEDSPGQQGKRETYRPSALRMEHSSARSWA